MLRRTLASSRYVVMVTVVSTLIASMALRRLPQHETTGEELTLAKAQRAQMPGGSNRDGATT